MDETLKDKRSILPKMTWPEVRDALKENDVVIVPISSTGQHTRGMSR
jgi:hypothetical protein